MKIRALELLLFTALALGISGCAMLVPGPAGDAGIRYTSKGASGTIDAGSEQLKGVSASVLAKMGIHPTGSSAEDGSAIVTGRGRVDQVTVRIDGHGSDSRVEVLDYTGNGNWNQDFAAIILLEIRGAV